MPAQEPILSFATPKALIILPDFLKALGKHKPAKSFFDTLNRANLYAIAYRLQTAKKPETRARMTWALAIAGGVRDADETKRPKPKGHFPG